MSWVRFGVSSTGACALLFMVAYADSEPLNSPTAPTADFGAAAERPTGGALGIPVEPSPRLRQADREYFEVCKDYVGAPGPRVTIDVSIGGASVNSVDLGHGECADVWGTGGPAVTVTVTEAVPTGYSASYQVWDLNGQTGPGAGNSASGLVGGATAPTGSLVVFTNTEVPALENGRFTGGLRLDDSTVGRITGGLTIHCDLMLSNNLEVNWRGGRFHMTEHLTTVECSDDPAIEQRPPKAPIDTLIGTGTGRYNGVDGATIAFTLVDAGEPGRNDKARLLIVDVNGTTQLDVYGHLSSGGNLQAHSDQPHGQRGNNP